VVQNAGDQSTTVTANYSDGTTASATIPPGASKMFDQSAETHPGKVFSATVTSGNSQPLVVAVVEESSTVMFAYNGFGAGSLDPVMPLVNANNSGYVTGIQIMNLGGSSTDVTLTYTPSLFGTATTEMQTIPAGQSKTFALAHFATGGAAGMRFVGSAKVTTNSASQLLVAIVNQLKGTQNGEAYGAFDGAAAFSTVVMPLIMDRNSGYSTGFAIMNVGTTPTTVTCTYSSSAVTATSGLLQPGSAFTELNSGKIADHYVGSGTCTASGGGQIVGVVNELGSSATADQFLVYEGISIP